MRGRPVEVLEDDRRDAFTSNGGSFCPSAHSSGDMEEAGALTSSLSCVSGMWLLRLHTYREDEVFKRGERRVHQIDPLLQLCDVSRSKLCSLNTCRARELIVRCRKRRSNVQQARLDRGEPL